MSVVLKERRSKDSVTLAWQGPERPNGAIVEYEVIYYEKVRERTHTHTKSSFTHEGHFTCCVNFLTNRLCF